MYSFLVETTFGFPFSSFVMMHVMWQYSDICLVFRAVDRQNFLETELKTVQASHKDLESFLKWLQEAETTVNVLADASQRENTAQDSVCIRELRKQMQVRNQIILLLLILFLSGKCYKAKLSTRERKPAALLESI